MSQAWRSFRRPGSVEAQRLTQRTRWTSQAGDGVNGEPGDWKITQDGRTWTVVDSVFRRRYAAEGPGFRSRGVIRARPGRAGELIETMEGPATVAEGDWVVKGEAGEEWLVPAEVFERSYSAVD